MTARPPRDLIGARVRARDAENRYSVRDPIRRYVGVRLASWKKIGSFYNNSLFTYALEISTSDLDLFLVTVNYF